MTHSEFYGTFAPCCQHERNCRNFGIGEQVTWNGSADPYSVRAYTGTIIGFDTLDGVAIVQDDGWHARNGVAIVKLRHLRQLGE